MSETQLPIGGFPNIVAIIPAYKPSKALLILVYALLETGFRKIVVVDDGSGPDYHPIFEGVERQLGVALLRHAVNLGKGNALKLGINHTLCNHPEAQGIVTVDADGQHQPDDVARVCLHFSTHPDSLVLGTRAFRGDVPFRSRFGNIVTRYVLRLVVGASICDTQTGLRVIPASFAPRLLKLTSSGYDFELDMLITANQTRLTLEQVPVATVYENGNRSSHFNPLVDSMKIYFVLLRFCSVSLGAALIDNLVFALAYHVWRRIGPAQLLSRSFGLIFIYIVVRRAVFFSRQRHAVTMPKFLTLAIVSGTISYVGIRLLVADTNISVLWAKILVESLIFFFNFAVQRDLIFSDSAEVQA